MITVGWQELYMMHRMVICSWKRNQKKMIKPQYFINCVLEEEIDQSYQEINQSNALKISQDIKRAKVKEDYFGDVILRRDSLLNNFNVWNKKGKLGYPERCHNHCFNF
jgi:hypothetical protein